MPSPKPTYSYRRFIINQEQFQGAAIHPPIANMRICFVSYLEPFSSKPSVQEVDGRLWLIHRYHMSCAEDVHEGEVAAALDSSSLLAIGLEVFHFGLIKGLLS
jgi:hypothetical protein